ncbi:hypothetical protein AB1Y20_001162 [Prymnesium parvum]|uniref:Uncharacterized protein n=1 Tax=Prymnesium parvum TaxID=97485 RepID=A0AB34KAA1_PRYPA
MPLNALPLAGADEPEWSDDDEFDDELELSLPDLSHDSKHNSPSRGPIFAARENVTACPPSAASVGPYTAASAPAPARPAGRDAAAPPPAAAACGGEGSRRPHERRAGRQLDDSIDFDEFLADESMGASMDYSSASISGIDSPEKPPPATRMPPPSSAPPPPPPPTAAPALAPPGKIPTEAPRAPPLRPLPSPPPPPAAAAAAASLPSRPISAPPAATPSMSDAMNAARAATERALANTTTGRADGAAPPVRRVLSITRRDSTGRILSKEIPSMVAPPAAAAAGEEDHAAAATAAGVKVEEGSAMALEGARLQAVTPKAEDEGEAQKAEIAGQKSDARVLSGQENSVGQKGGAGVQEEIVGRKVEPNVQEEENLGRNVETHVHKEESVDRTAEAHVRQEGALGREAEAAVRKTESVGRSIGDDVNKEENVGRPAEADAWKVEGAGIETESGARKAESVTREALADIQKEERDARALVPAAGHVSSQAVSQKSSLPSAQPAAPKSSFFPHCGDSSRGIVLRRAVHILPRSLAHVCVEDLFNSDEEEEEATPAAPPPASRASHEARPTSLPSLAEEPSAPPSASTSSARDSADEASRQGSEGVALSEGDDESSEAGSESSRQRSEGGERSGGGGDESSRGGSESSSREATPRRGSGAVGSFLLRAAGAQFLTVDDIDSEPSASPRSAAHERDDTGTDVADTRLAQAHGANAESTALALYEEPAATLASCQAMVLAHAAVCASSAGDVHEERMDLPRHREASQMLPVPPSNKKDARSPKAKMLPVPPSNKPDTRSSTAKLWPVPEGKHRVGPSSSFNHRLSRRNVPDASALAEQELEERLTLLVMSMLVQ